MIARLQSAGRGVSVDLALAGVVLAVGLTDALMQDQRGGPVLNGLAALAMAGLVLRRRTGPLGAVVAAHSVLIIGSALLLARLDEGSAGWILQVTLLYAFGRYYPRRQSLWALAAMTAAITVMYAVSGMAVTSDFVFPQVIGAAIWLVGRSLRQRARMTAELQELAEQAREAAETELAVAQADERRRLAREMHDVIAHSLSLMVVQAGGARRILPTDPERAAEAAGLIEEAGRASLLELRRLLGALDPGRGDQRAPAPELADLPALLEQAVAAGMDVEFVEVGRRPEISGGLGLAAYRIVQEALTNALRHAGPVPARVVLRWSERALEVDVANDAPVRRAPALPSGGHGLVGMAERAHLYGGTLAAGTQPSGGYRVTAQLRLDGQEVPS